MCFSPKVVCWIIHTCSLQAFGGSGSCTRLWHGTVDKDPRGSCDGSAMFWWGTTVLLFIRLAFLYSRLLHSYVLMHCITVLSESFCWCVLPYANCSSRVYVMQVKGNSSKNSVRTCLPWNQSGQWYKVKHLRRPAIAGPVSWQWIVCTLLETLRCITQTLDLAVSGARCPRIIWQVRL